MMQIELEDLRESMRTNRRLFNRIEMQFPAGGNNSQELANEKAKKQDELREQYERSKQRYRSRLSGLATLNRRIASDSKTLGLTTRNVPATAINKDRLVRFEEKLDQIIEVLNGKADP